MMRIMASSTSRATGSSPGWPNSARIPLACQALAPLYQRLDSEPAGTAANRHWTRQSGGIELPARHDG